MDIRGIFNVQIFNPVIYIAEAHSSSLFNVPVELYHKLPIAVITTSIDGVSNRRTCSTGSSFVFLGKRFRTTAV
jgi:hypothetical protein